MTNYTKSIGALAGMILLVLACTTTPVKKEISKPSKADNLKLQKGFKAEHLYAISENDQGSWVSMCFDDKGRMIVSDQYGGLYRLEIPAIGEEDSVKVEKIQIQNYTSDFGAAHGLLYAFNSLYLMVNNKPSEERPQSSGFYRLQDTNGDDSFDKLTLLQELKARGEHGPHSIKLSPDGKSLYVISGNHTELPQQDAYRLPKTWAYDNLFPEIKDPRGHANNYKEPGGWVAKVDPDGKNWELMSAGYRNAFDLAFNDIGDLFVYDADMEWDFGTPWYRPTRIVHATSGAEFGWRTGNGKWPASYPDNLPAALNIGQGSPTNLLYLKEANFPTKYNQSLLAFDWSFGIMHAIHLSPNGASYSAEREEFLSGVPLPLTDGAIGPDGALYFLTGGRRLESDLYRVYYEGDTQKEEQELTLLTEENKLRRTLEKFHEEPNDKAITISWPELKNPDRFIRYAARIAIEHQPLGLWQEKALNEKDPVIKTNAIISLARSATSLQKENMLRSLLEIKMKSLPEQQQLDVLRAYEIIFSRMGQPLEETKHKIIAKLNPLYPALIPKKNQALSKLLLFLDASDVVAKTMKLLAQEEDKSEIAGGETATTSADLILRNPQYGLDIARMLEKVPPLQQTYFAMVLSEAKNGWTPELREEYFKWYKKAFSYKGGNSYVGFIDKARNIALDLVPQNKREFYDELSGGGLLSNNGNEIASDEYPKGPRRKWKLAEAESFFKEPLKNRNYKRGKAMYTAATCKNCHSIHGEGGSIGPDLTQLGTRFSTKDMLEAIIEPSKTISDQYEATQFQMKDGASIVARIINETDDFYSVSQNPYAPDYLINLSKDDIISKQSSDVSVMLPGLINSLNEEELRDLIAYIMAGGNEGNAMFSK